MAVDYIITIPEAVRYLTELKRQFEARAADPSFSFSDDVDTMLEDLTVFVATQHDLADEAFLKGGE